LKENVMQTFLVEGKKRHILGETDPCVLLNNALCGVVRAHYDNIENGGMPTCKTCLKIKKARD